MIITHPTHQAIPKLYVCSLCTKESTVRLLGKKKMYVCVYKAQPLPHKIRDDVSIYVCSAGCMWQLHELWELVLRICSMEADLYKHRHVSYTVSYINNNTQIMKYCKYPSVVIYFYKSQYNISILIKNYGTCKNVWFNLKWKNCKIKYKV